MYTASFAQHPPAQRLQEAINLAETRGDCISAIKIFEEIAKAPDRNLAARSLLYAARCYDQLGRPEAAKAYQKLIQLFPEQREYAAEARARLGPPSRGLQRNGLPVLLVAGLIEVPTQPFCVAIASGGREAYVTRSTAEEVTVIDTATNNVSATVRVGAHAGWLRASPDGSKVYLTSYPETGLRILDTRTKTVRLVPIGGPASGVAVSPDGKFVYVAAGEGGLRRFDTFSGLVKVSPAVGYALDVAVTPDGRRVWVTFQIGGPGGRAGHDAIAVFDAATLEMLGTVPGSLPNVGGQIAITPDGSRVWTSASDACTRPVYDHFGCPPGAKGLIHIIDANAVRALEPLQSSGSLGYVTFLFGGTLAAVGTADGMRLLNARTRALVASAAVPTSGCMAVTLDGLHAYVPSQTQMGVALMELFLHAIVEVIPPNGGRRAGSDSTVTVLVQVDPLLENIPVDLNSLRFAGTAVARDQITKPGPDGSTQTVVFRVNRRDLKLNPGDNAARFEAKTVTGLPIRGVLAFQ